jgi:hypothetical protein
MRIHKSDLIVLLQTLYVGVVSLGVSYLIGFATSANALIIAALPLGLILVLALAWLKPRAQLVGWAVASAWLLSSVYLGVSEVEYVVLVGVFLLSLAGVLWSPWFLVALWFLHPLWDFVPRELPDAQHDLPLACFIYDLVVAIYLLWRTKRGFFSGAVIAPAKPTKLINTGWSRMLVGLYVVAIMVTEIVVVGSITMDSSSVMFSGLVALALIAAIIWLPAQAQRLFWVAFTIWMGMSFAHSGAPLEILVFFAMIAMAVLGYRVNPLYWAIAWELHSLWYFFPREHNMGAAMLMGHWMVPLAGFVFETAIAVYIVVRRKALSPK